MVPFSMTLKFNLDLNVMILFNAKKIANGILVVVQDRAILTMVDQ